MLYHSTRDNNISVRSAEAIARGLSPDGGLFVPEGIPALTEDMLTRLTAQPYSGRAAEIIGLFLDDFSRDELHSHCAGAYGEGFDGPDAAPVVRHGDMWFLELWHGPTCAFKDMALRMLPRLLTASLVKTGETRKPCVLVATSGDTGKAALEGFRDVSGTKIMVFYPQGGVSDVQKLQMTTQEGGNVAVVAVEGNFDDAQAGVKNIFSDEKLRNRVDELGWFLSSANSINWGRLVPQIAYYISAYCDIVKSGGIKSGEPVNFCVPTGNFGNILAGYYAKMMGLPIKKLICASNRNDVLADFIASGIYDRNRPFYQTMSPSMDILVSSNLERLLYGVSGGDDKLVAGYMKSLADSGRYQVPDAVREAVTRNFWGGKCSEQDTAFTISDIYKRHGYLIDTHTAVAVKVLDDYRNSTRDATPAIIVSTASPFKFCDSVLSALGHDTGGGAELLDKLSKVTGTQVPSPLRGLRGRPERFSACVTRGDMSAAALKFLEN